MMLKRTKNYFDKLKRSLWFIPFVMTLLGLFLSVAVSQLDWFFWQRQLPYLGQAWGIDLEGIRYLFSNIGAAIITAMTTILSVTLLIFTVLAGQYGSHILRAFKIQSFNKFVIGWFSGTYVYITYNIYRVTTSSSDYIPQISVTLGVIFAFVTIFLLILYIHFLVRQIQAETVISGVAEELCDSITSLEKYEPMGTKKEQVFLPEQLDILNRDIALGASGYIQSIDKEELCEIAKKTGSVIKVHHRAGQFIMSYSPAFTVYAKQFSEDDKSLAKSCFIVGKKRIPVEDLECNLELLVEMTERALSPGINDLVVANNCIDYIGESISLLAKRQFPEERRYDDEGKLLLITKEFSFEGYLDAALNPIRQYAAMHCSVAIRLLDVLIAVFQITDIAKYRQAISKHFQAIYQSATENQNRSIDLASIHRRKQKYQSLFTETT